MTINYTESYDVITFEVLYDIFDKKEGIMINDVIYTDWQDILDVYDAFSYQDVDEDTELSRIASLCWEFVERKYNFKDN